MDRGVSGTGAGFDAKSMGRLGGRGPVPIHNPDPRKLREVAVQVRAAPSAPYCPSQNVKFDHCQLAQDINGAVVNNFSRLS